MIRHRISAFRTTALSKAYLKRLNRDFATARRAGMKVVFRFTYNYPKGGPDASLKRVLQHLGQLRPVFRQNVDVIAFMDLGFIGCWGEMHTSSNRLVEPNTRHLNQATKKIIVKALEVLPKERMIAVRYPAFKLEYFGTQNPYEHAVIPPLTASEAFTGTPKARWGQHDDCIVCGEWNAGTWWSKQNDAPALKRYLAQDNLYVVQSGETGNPYTTDVATDEDRDGYTLGEHDSCKRVLDIFEQLHFSTFNAEFDTGVTDRWQREGCYDDIAKRLGYRYRLLSAELPTTVRAGGQGSLSLELTNDGFAGLYNPRKMALVLRHQTTDREFTIDLTADEDLHLWLPEPGKTERLEVAVNLPRRLQTGRYELFLNLPDPARSLRKRPEYSVRLANQGVWEAKTGYNRLDTSLEVTR